MSDFDHLKNRLKRGYISRRNFVRSAVALGITASTAISFARSGYAADGAKFAEAREGFPVARRAKLLHPDLDKQVWNANDPVDMFRYTVALLNSAIRDAEKKKVPHPLEDAFLAYAYSLAASESWTFDKVKNPREFALASDGLPAVGKRASELVQNAVDSLSGKADQVQALWAMAIVDMNFGRTEEAVKTYRGIKDSRTVPEDERSNFMFEMADALVHAGEVDEALKHLGRGPELDPVLAGPDWHLHQLAWCYFVRAGRREKELDKLGDYNLALSSLAKRQNGAGDVGHLALADLLAAACFAQKARVLGAAGQTDAERQLDARARDQLRRARADNSNLAGWKSAEARNYAPFSDTKLANADLAHWLAAVQRAGIEEY